MEACCGAHYLGRQRAAQGHTVKLMAPEYVRPYVKAQKNDDRDAEAIAEAATRPTMLFVELKTQEQLDMQSLHRVRSRLVGARTSLINQLRAVPLERGMTAPQRRRKFEQMIDALLNDHERLPQGRLRELVIDMRSEWTSLDARIAAFERTDGRIEVDAAAFMLEAALPLMLNFFGLLRMTAFMRNIDSGKEPNVPSIRDPSLT